MCYDVSQTHRETKRNNDSRLQELKNEYPDTWFNLSETRKLLEQNRQADFYIRDYDRMIKMGVKF
jgi:hypothetical protein